MTIIIKSKSMKKIVLLLLTLLFLSHTLYAQGKSDPLLNRYYGEMSVIKLVVNNKCAYTLLDSIDYCWSHSSLNNVPCLALIKYDSSNNWEVEILQLYHNNYLSLKSLSFNFIGSLQYKNKLYVLRCLDSLDLIHIHKFFSQTSDSIKILPDIQTFFNDTRNYQFIMDTLKSAEPTFAFGDWETLMYSRSISLTCAENENCFQCKEIFNKQK